MKTRFFAPVFMLFLITMACSLIPSSAETEHAPNLSGNVLFQDDFSDTSSGWDRVNIKEETIEYDGITDYADGSYRIYVNTENVDVWANPGLNFSDVQVEVDATKVGGDDNNDFGVICRYQDLDNFYFFIISSDGYYGIGKYIEGQQVLIGVESMPPSELIRQGEASNHIRADCIGNTLAIYVNGVQLAEYQDTSYTSGDVGLLAGSIESPGVDIYFDNFKVLLP